MLPNLTHRHSLTGRRGFTLIELLTVIAIIGILAAILVPTVGAVRRKAATTQSACNLRQFGAGFQLFASEHKNRLPPAYDNQGKTPYNVWTKAIAPYLSVENVTNNYAGPESLWFHRLDNAPERADGRVRRSYAMCTAQSGSTYIGAGHKNDGYGDGGGGPTESMIERARRLNNLAGVPKTNWGNIEPFFDRLHANRERLPEVAGDLILELHRGVFTTHGVLKSAFRGLERALQIHEAAHVIRGLGPIDEHAWRRAAFSHFHDYIPGSSVWEVYAEALPELATLTDAALASADQALGQSAAPAAQDCVFNPLPIARNWVDARRRVFRLKPLSGEVIEQAEIIPATVPTVHLEAGGDAILSSDRVTARFDQQGRATRLVLDGKAIALGASAEAPAHLAAYADNPTAHPAWDMDRAALVNGKPARLLSGPEIVHDAATGAVAVVYHFALATKSTVSIRYSITPGETVLRVAYDIDWQDPLMCLKAIVPTRYRGHDVRFGAPFGSSLRGQWPGYAREEANWELPASRWFTVTDDAQSSGFSIITKDKYGVSARDGVVGLALLRSAFVTEANDHPHIREGVRPVHSDLGKQRVEMAWAAFQAGAPAEAQPATLADTLFTPCFTYRGSPAQSGLVCVQDAPSLAPSWAEPQSEGWVLRLHETLGRDGTAKIVIGAGWKATPITLDGSPVGAPATGSLDLPFAQYKVLSVKFSKN